MKYHWLIVLLITLSGQVAAAAKDDIEIKHLLSFVASTACLYERNGQMHNGEAAAKHIKKKYHYYLDDIISAEEFIEWSATKSSLSGKYYKIHCPNQPTVLSQKWLLSELNPGRDYALVDF